MTDDRLQEAVPDGEALRYVGDLRPGGRVGITDERLLVVREEVVSVEFSSVERVEMEDVDWFTGLLSLGLFGVGLYGLARNPLLGVAFAGAGAASVYWTYRTRGRLTVNVHSRPKPLELYPADGSGLYAAVGDALDAYRERHGLDAADV